MTTTYLFVQKNYNLKGVKLSSPLGGFYLSAINRRSRAKFDLAAQVHISVTIAVQLNGESKINQQQQVCIGNSSMVENKTIKVEFSTEVLASGLLQLACTIFKKTSDNQSNYLGKQELNLSPNESLSSLVEGGKSLLLTVIAAPVDS